MTRNARFALSASLLAVCAAFGGTASAQNTVSDPYIAKQLSNSVRGNLFMRLGVTSIFPKTKAGDAYDVTGPVVTPADLSAAAAIGDNLPEEDPLSSANFDGRAGSTYSALVAGLNSAIGTGLGTPAGIKSRVGKASTVTLSVGYWLSDDHTWVAEAYILAAPFKIKAYGSGVNASGNPNGLSGKQIIETKMLPPLAVLGRYFGDADNRFRPYLGVGATYVAFFDTKTTSLYDDYVGGKSTASLTNAFGVGPFAGLKAEIADDWHVSLAIGQVKIRTKATLVTNNTLITSESGVVNDYDPVVVNLINSAENNAPSNVTGSGRPRWVDSQVTTKLMKLVAQSKGRTDLGSFERKQDVAIRNTIVNLSVGRSF